MNYFLSALILLSSLNLFAKDKVVYGEDNRKDVFESSNQLYKTLSQSTAAMIPNGSLSKNEDGSFRISGLTLESDGVCSDARFAKQIIAANCSGFLVGEQYLVTAGHCIDSNSCASFSWVFGFSNESMEKSEYNVADKDIYTCKEIISRTLDRATLNDYALVKLDRKVSGRSPLKFRKSGTISDKSGIVVIGHPSGLPVKIADGANVRTNKNKFYFQANLDTFGGNSGSAVFDAKTGVVEGILVRGETDYVSDSTQNCMRPKVCKDDECRGEDVTRITNIKELSKIRIK